MRTPVSASVDRGGSRRNDAERDKVGEVVTFC